MVVVGVPHEADNTEQVYSQQECKQCRPIQSALKLSPLLMHAPRFSPRRRSAFFSPTPIIKLKPLSLFFVIKSVTVI